MRGLRQGLSNISVGEERKLPLGGSPSRLIWGGRGTQPTGLWEISESARLPLLVSALWDRATVTLHVSVQGITEAHGLCSTGDTAEQVLGSLLYDGGVGGCSGRFSRVLGTAGVSGDNCAGGQGQQGGQAKGKCLVVQVCRGPQGRRGGACQPRQSRLVPATQTTGIGTPLGGRMGALESRQPGRLELGGPLLKLGA